LGRRLARDLARPALMRMARIAWRYPCGLAVAGPCPVGSPGL